MTAKDLLIQELNDASEPQIVEVLDFLRFLKAKQAEDRADLLDARAGLAAAKSEGTVSWQELKAETGL